MRFGTEAPAKPIGGRSGHFFFVRTFGNALRLHPLHPPRNLPRRTAERCGGRPRPGHSGGGEDGSSGRRRGTGAGNLWEGLVPWSDPEEENDVLRRSSALPRLSDAAVSSLLQHCARTLGALRSVLPGAEWDVAVDHVPVPWEGEKYVISQEHLDHYRQSMVWEAGLA